MIIFNILLIFLFLFFLVTILQQLCCFFYLYIETQGTIPRKIFIKNFIKEYLYINNKWILYPLRFLHLSVINKKYDPNHAIVLIHGYCRSRTDWLLVKSKISKKLNKNVFLFNLKPPFSTIDKITKNLNADLLKLQSKHNIKQFTLIGHSMGGLISSYYEEFINTDKNLIKQIVTLGSPLHGTKIACIDPSHAAQQMRINSEILKTLRNKIKNNINKYVFVASKVDNIIFPWNSSIIDRNYKNNIIIESESHQGLIYNIMNLGVLDKLL